MKFKTFKSNNQDYIDIKNLPILILDPFWLKSFPESVKTPTMKEAENNLTEFLKQQGKINTQYNELNKNKKKMLKKMLELSEKVRKEQLESDKNELQKYQSEISLINESLKILSEQIKEVPKNIENENNKLFQESVKISYNKLFKNLKEIQKLEPIINSLREKLRTETTKIELYEKEYKENAQFLTNFIGTDGIQILNEKYNGSI